MKPARIACLALLAAVVFAAPAAAHNVKVSPKAGDSATKFIFKGTKWQPGGDVLVQYYATEDSNQPFRTRVILTRADGRFKVSLVRPASTAAFGVTARMCFTQDDSRLGRRFRKCKRFYVDPPTARFWPSTGPPGTPFLLMTSGWYPGMQLVLQLERPDGVLETYTDMSPTRRRGAFFAVGEPFGSIFVRKGATYRLFPGDPNVLVGDYLATVRAANGTGAVIRTVVTVTPP